MFFFFSDRAPHREEHVGTCRLKCSSRSFVVSIIACRDTRMRTGERGGERVKERARNESVNYEKRKCVNRQLVVACVRAFRFSFFFFFFPPRFVYTRANERGWRNFGILVATSYEYAHVRTHYYTFLIRRTTNARGRVGMRVTRGWHTFFDFDFVRGAGYGGSE